MFDEPHRWPFARMTPTETSTVVVVPGSHLMSALLGQRDLHLRQIERHFPDTTMTVRGNEIAIRGDDTVRVASLFEELVGLLQRGHELDERTIDRSIGMVRADERPSRGAHRTTCSAAPRAGRCDRRRPARSATSTPSATTSSRSASARPAPASRGWPWRWRCRRCRPSRCSGSSSPALPSRPGSGSASCPAT